MAVVSVWPKWEGRGATTDEKGVKTLKRQWGVLTDDDATGEPAVIDAVVAVDPTAALYASHPQYAPAVCRKLVAAPFQGPRSWTVDADYSSAPFPASGDGSGSGGNSTSPTAAQSALTPADQRPPTISISRKEISEPLEADVVTGAPLVNTVGDKFDPPVEVFRSRHLITWKFFRQPADLDWDNRADWQDSINSDAVTILGKRYEPYSLRCTEYAAETVWETGTGGLMLFFALTVQAEYDPNLWTVSVLNTGRRELVVGKKVEVTDQHGQPVAEPVPLTAAGVPVAPGGAYHYVTADGYEAFHWNGTGGTLFGAGGLLA